MRTCLMIVLAAGEGTRMKSALPKVLHAVGGLSMVGHVVSTALAAGADRLAAVIGPGAEAVGTAVRALAPQALVFEQTERLGTAHAVLQARAALDQPVDDVLVLYGDTPLVRPGSLERVRAQLAEGADIAVLGFEAANPHGYGRLIEQNDRLVAIREEKDASASERQIRFANSGILGFRGGLMLSILDAIGNTNAKGEFYLTDAVEIAHARGLKAVAVRGDEAEFMGVNDRAQLAACEAVFQGRKRAEAMAAGVTLIDPASVHFAHDTRLARAVVIEPHVVFGPGVEVETGVVVRAFSHLEGAKVRAGATVGPFARLRPKADIGEGAHIGNFVEIKAAVVETGAKVNHLTYIGDARVGAKANIGAGTITCNYDGFGKYHTDIGAGAFIGSNSSLVAPGRIGDGGIVGAGSVITEDIEADALALARPPLRQIPAWAKAFRTRMAKARSKG